MQHPHESTLIAYAAGALDEGAALVVAAHSERCFRCADQVGLAESLGGLMLANADGSVPSAPEMETGIEQCLARIRAGGEPETSAPAVAVAIDDDLPRALAPYLTRDLDSLAWRKLGRGVWHYPLKVSGSGSGWTRLFCFAPGVRVPEHGHAGSELTLVLRGSYRDALGHFGPGDCADLDSSHQHQPEVDSSDDCIALISSSERVYFHNSLYRLGGRLIGI